MRIVGTIPHPKMTITLFHMNDKFMVKFEAGLMEQVYKFRQEEVKGIEELKTLINGPFITKVITRFNEMFLDLQGLKPSL